MTVLPVSHSFCRQPFLPLARNKGSRRAASDNGKISHMGDTYGRPLQLSTWAVSSTLLTPPLCIEIFVLGKWPESSKIPGGEGVSDMFWKKPKLKLHLKKKKTSLRPCTSPKEGDGTDTDTGRRRSQHKD